jgi:hypothetical protein
MNKLPEIKREEASSYMPGRRSSFSFVKLLIFLLAFSLSLSVSAQDLKRRSKPKKLKPAREAVTVSPKVRKAMKKQEKKKQSELRALKREREKATKRHLSQQSEGTRLRMAESAEESKSLNRKTKKPLFKKKIKGKRR